MGSRLVLAAIVLGVLGACGGEAEPDSAPGDVTIPPAASGENPPAQSTSGGPEAPSPPGTSGGPPATGTCSGKAGVAGDRSVSVTSGGRQRAFELHVPATYDPKKKTPLVLLFHGYTQDAKGIASVTHFAKVADAHGMIVAFPSGVSNSFNAGDCCGTAVSSNVDDVGFTKDMIKTLDGEYCVDEKRVYAAGFSNGGYLSYRLACELSDQIAAVAPVSGGLRLAPADCKPKRPLSLLHIHGTNDLVVPYNGGGLSASRSVDESVSAFRTKNKCPAGDGAVYFEKGDVSCKRWSGCEASTAVELCTVTNGGHQWPGGADLPYGGSASKNIDASEAIATFFEAHPMP